MAGVTEGVTIKGLIETQAVLNDLLDRVEDLSPLMAGIADYGRAATLERFEDERGPDGAGWKPSHRAMADGGKTLHASGDLKNRIGAYSGKDFAEWGSPLFYAVIHQEGATIRAKSASFLHFFIPGIGFRRPAEVVIPARPFLGINAEDDDEIDAIIRGYIAEAIP